MTQFLPAESSYFPQTQHDRERGADCTGVRGTTFDTWAPLVYSSVVTVE